MVEIHCNGQVIRGFSAVQITRALDQFAGTYSMQVFKPVSNADGSTAAANSLWVPVFPDDEVEVYVDGEKIIKGYNEKTSPAFSADNFSCAVAGKEITADAVKCPPETIVFENKKVDEICRIICGEVGLVFDGAAGANVGAPLKKFSVDPGASAYEVMIKACAECRVMLLSNGLGHVRIDGGKYKTASVDLVQGKNVLSASGDFSNEKRYSNYRVYAASDASGKIYAEVKDDDVKRKRRFVLLDENFANKENCEARAMWEAKHRQAESNKLTVTVSGWRQKQGAALWAPGQTVNVDLPSMLGEVRQFLINRVTFSLGSNGTTTTLQLVDPFVYAPAPSFPSAKKSVKATKAKKDIWASVRKATGSKLGKGK